MGSHLGKDGAMTARRWIALLGFLAVWVVLIIKVGQGPITTLDWVALAAMAVATVALAADVMRWVRE